VRERSEDIAVVKSFTSVVLAGLMGVRRLLDWTVVSLVLFPSGSLAADETSLSEGALTGICVAAVALVLFFVAVFLKFATPKWVNEEWKR